MARQRALEARLKVNQGICPAQAKKTALVHIKETKTPKFSDFALEYIETMRPKWRNQKHADQWVSTVRTYAFPILGEMRLDEIDTPDIQKVLMPIWLKIPESASRLRGRIEKILSAATFFQLFKLQDLSLSWLSNAKLNGIKLRAPGLTKTCH